MNSIPACTQVMNAGHAVTNRVAWQVNRHNQSFAGTQVGNGRLVMPAGGGSGGIRAIARYIPPHQGLTPGWYCGKVIANGFGKNRIGGVAILISHTPAPTVRPPEKPYGMR